TQFDLRPHMDFDRWPQIYAGIQQHLQKIYNGKKAALKDRHWRPHTFPRQIGMHRLCFGMIPRTLHGLLKINKTRQRARSYADRDPGLLPPSEICM
ncbi:hypothetical protein Tco_0082480, partial [Tanacetum coccineum]